MNGKDKDSYYSKTWIGCPLEHEYFGDDRKLGKEERKKASAKDRSKYKKTDKMKADKNKAKFEGQGYFLGRVISITPQGIVVSCDGMDFTCNLRGLLKKEKGQHKNLVTVGDFVNFEKNSSNEGVIVHVTPRKTLLSRADNLSRRKEQLIAANIDLVLITVSVVEPSLKPFLVDRYIIAARKGGMTPVIVVNKIDLLEKNDDFLVEQERVLYKQFLKAYEFADVRVIAVSAQTGEGMDLLRETMKDKASVFSGQSGVGKSSLINEMTGFGLKTGHIVEKTKKGTHTTTTANLLPLPFGGWCIDTPGIKSFGIWDLKSDEIETYFSEMAALQNECKYPSCTHIHEDACKVKEAVESGDISLLRYQSYLYLKESIDQEHLRR